MIHYDWPIIKYNVCSYTVYCMFSRTIFVVSTVWLTLSHFANISGKHLCTIHTTLSNTYGKRSWMRCACWGRAVVAWDPCSNCIMESPAVKTTAGFHNLSEALQCNISPQIERPGTFPARVQVPHKRNAASGYTLLYGLSKTNTGRDITTKA